MYNNLPLSHHTSTTQNSISAMAPPTNNHTNHSRPFDLSRSGNSHNKSSTQDNKMSSSSNNQNTTPSLSHNKNHENTSNTMANQTNKNLTTISSSNQNNQIASYPPLRQMNNFHTISTLPRQNHHSITPTPLRQNTTAASLSQFDGGSGGSTASSNTLLVQHKSGASSSPRTIKNASPSSSHQTGGEGIGRGGSTGVSSPQHFRPATPTPYPAINGAWNQNGNNENHDVKSNSTSQPSQHIKSTSSNNTNSGTHKPTPAPIANPISNTHAKAHSSPTPTPTDIPKRSAKPSRPAVDPRYDPNLTLAQRLEASTDLPLAPFSEYGWKSKNEYVNMTSWQPPERHSKEWRQRDLEGWR